MNIQTFMKISKDFYINGSSQFINLKSGITQWIMNNQYHVIINEGEIISKEALDDILTIYTIKHEENPTITFKGYLTVPKNTSQTKKGNYLEAHVQSGIIPLIYPFIRFDININLVLPDEYYAVGFDKKDDSFYHIAKDTIDVVFVIYRQEDLNIYKNDYVTVYAQPYHNIENLRQMADVSKNIYMIYENYFGQLDNNQFHIVLNPRFENGAYTRRGIVCLVDRIEGLDVDTFQHLAHEISHLWWYNSDMKVENDWLNESFAQYSSLLLVKEKFGNEYYQKFINDWKEKSQDLPSLASVNQNTKKRYEINYYKGPYLITLLYKDIGDKKMCQLLRNTYQQHISTSNDFLKLCPQFKKYYQYK